MIKFLVTLLFSISLVTQGYAEEIKKPLPAAQAFQFSSAINPKQQLILEWQIAPGHYLYRDQFQIENVPTSPVKIGKIQWPKTKTKNDKLFGKFHIYKDHLKLTIPLLNPAAGIVDVQVNYQGCSEQGYCYPPETKNLHINVAQDEIKNNVVVTSLPVQPPPAQTAEDIFSGDNDFIIILSFLGLGLLLAFTPCVLPMIPILSGIIVGHKHLTTAKSFFLSLAYVLGMAITYAIAGMVVALMGSRIQTYFQSPWVIVIGSALFILLALSLFGFYELRLPSKWQKELTDLSNRQKGGTYVGVFLMGVLSSLMVSPCVTAPLVGVLAYIARTGDVILGGVALLALGFGMGIPLLLIGISAGKLLPKAGVWMIVLERFFGIMLLGVAILLLSRILPGPVTLFLWSVLLIGTALFMGVFVPAKNNWYNLLRAFGLVLLVYSGILMIGAAMGNSNPLQPWEKVGFSIKKNEIPFVTLKNMAEFDSVLQHAKKDGKPVMLDFYADWCTACVSLDHYVFAQADVQKALERYVLLRADITHNDDFDQALLKRFNVIAPPTILFFSPKDDENSKKRIVGEVNKKEFLQHLQHLGW